MRKSKSLVSVFLAFCLVFSCPIFMGGTSDETLSGLIAASAEMFSGDNVEPRKAYYLKNLDGSEDFVIVEFKKTGYAIFLKETSELLEYCPKEKSPYNKGAKKSYYAGPGKYYTKENDKFTDAVTDNEVAVENPAETAQKIRDIFIPPPETEESENAPLTSQVRNGKIESDKPDDITDTDEGTYIDNAWYFLNNPTHVSDANIDPSGSCTVTATQLLLSYHNYFSDRRLIPAELSDGTPTEFLSENYGELDKRKNQDAIGTQEEFFLTLAYYIDNILPFGQTLLDAKTGINNYLSAYTSQKVSMEVHLPIVDTYNNIKAGVENEINNNRPLIIGMDRTVVDSFHVVVCYGYRTYDEAYGYIVHYGWGTRHFHAWTNANWYMHYLTMQVNHRHTYEYIGGDYHEEKCGVCGQTNIRNVHTYEKSYTIIDGAKHRAYCSCGASRTENHSLADCFQYDENSHTIICACRYVSYEEHSFKNQRGPCTLCEYERFPSEEVL